MITSFKVESTDLVESTLTVRLMTTFTGQGRFIAACIVELVRGVLFTSITTALSLLRRLGFRIQNKCFKDPSANMYTNDRELNVNPLALELYAVSFQIAQ